MVPQISKKATSPTGGIDRLLTLCKYEYTTLASETEAMRMVDLVRIPLDQPPPVVDDLAKLLAPGERERAYRFRFTRDRGRFIVARAALRQLLGASLGQPPSLVAFTYGPNGKPALADAGAGLCFNLSHSAELALCALAPGTELGVDVEAHRPLDDMDALAERFFAPAEVAWLQQQADRMAAFFRLWTCKEAYVKALGLGLSLDTRSFAVDLAAGRVGDWYLRAFTPAPGYAAALCSRTSVTLNCWDWQP